MSKHTTRHYCRNTHCRAKLAAPVDNEHHAFCTSGCHAIFYRHRCLVCEDAMRRKRHDQRFKNGHKNLPERILAFSSCFRLSRSKSRPTLPASQCRPHKPLILAGQKWPLAATYPAKCSGAIKRGAAGIGNPKTSVSTDCSAALAILRRVSMSAAENGCSLGRAFFPSSGRTLRMPVSGLPYLRRLLHCRLIR